MTRGFRQLSTLNIKFINISIKYSRASFSIKEDREFLLSNIVNIIPLSFNSGFKLFFTASIVFINLDKPQGRKFTLNRN